MAKKNEPIRNVRAYVKAALDKRGTKPDTSFSAAFRKALTQ